MLRGTAQKTEELVTPLGSNGNIAVRAVTGRSIDDGIFVASIFEALNAQKTLMQKDCQSYCSPGKFAISVRESVIKSGSRIIGKKNGRRSPFSENVLPAGKSMTEMTFPKKIPRLPQEAPDKSHVIRGG